MLHVISMHISLLCVFLLMTYCLLSIYFRLGKWCQTNSVNFLIRVQKGVVKPWRFKKSCKGDESLEDEECSGQPSEADNDWGQSLVLFLLQLHEKLPKSSVLTILQSFSISSKQERWRKLGEWVPCELTEYFKTGHFEVLSSLILWITNEPFLNWSVTCDEK